jgi:TonB family protein
MVMLAACLSLAACAGMKDTAHRSNRPMPPGSIVGQESPDWDTPARLATGDAPVYPANEYLTAGSGCAEVEFAVAADGSTRDVRVLQATRAVYGRHLAAAAGNWRFDPATRAGHPVASRMRVSFSFYVDHGWESPNADHCAGAR